MLVLSRKENEAVCIGSDVRVIVIEIRDGKVRLGIEAPRTTPVHRQEIWLAIREEQTDADTAARAATRGEGGQP